MTSILLVEHNGTIKQVKTKDISRDLLYKKCGFRTAEHFDKTTTWSIEYNKEIINIELWAKNNGKANNENKYDFPPPVDNALYYGTCALIRVDGKGDIIELSSDLWLRLYEKLFGGFEEIDEDGDEEDGEEEDDEEDEEDEEDDITPAVKTKNGYLKDDFIDDDEDDEDDEEEEDDGPHVSIKNKKKPTVIAENNNEEDDYYGSELEEEAYSYSDEE